MFVIEDELHAEWQGEFWSRQEAIAELQRRALIPWNEKPNAAPCTSWVTCGRRHELVEFDDGTLPWRELSRTLMLEISAAGVQWFAEGPG
ncbi:hypothetical protein [Bradyrhizobium liaoningense]|uniref:hypothetical protein n=1 Tax=Bradyrhizobium liaoningense TaxID=43992 RepID=UPI001BA57DF8|nr:hypothetical protein [Bradyrhizobium liaoningense]MBR0705108.1 hypothetical protein [Bradyrhizobium liaoningense]